ncbi:SMI1/KNR4 family protein [Streptomyces sp. NPDC093109]|uniref:SMI1/KNR4 family protein n=1 Tax=Streptomyces sp. NPDC093109 TaxID=3154977 RepID=UPI00344E69FC
MTNPPKSPATGTERLLKAVTDHAAASPTPYAGPVPEPLGPAAIARAEAALGFALPPLLAGLYTRVGDGGFGPGYGLLPLEGAVTAYAEQRAGGDDDWGWPEGVLPLADWGCGMLACVDCRSEDAAVLLFEPNADFVESAWYVDTAGLDAWLRGWLDGTAWFMSEDGDMDVEPWPGFADRTAVPTAS